MNDLTPTAIEVSSMLQSSAAGVKRLFKSFFGIALCIALFASATCQAQFSGSLQGTVEDSTGAAVPSAVVTLTNVDTNVTQNATADDSGVYRFASLAPGSYQVSATAQGFAGSKTENSNPNTIPLIAVI